MRINLSLARHVRPLLFFSSSKDVLFTQTSDYGEELSATQVFLLVFVHGIIYLCRPMSGKESSAENSSRRRFLFPLALRKIGRLAKHI